MSFNIVEDRDIILLQTRKYDQGLNENLSVIRMEEPKLEVPVQGPESHAYSVPLVNPARPATTCASNARASIYLYLIPSGMPVFKQIEASCYKCTKILQRRGTDIVAPLRSIGTNSLVEGQNLMLDVAGPWLLFCKPRYSQAVTRAAGRTKRDQIKLFVLVTVYMFSHRVECAVIDSMHTGSLQSALKQIMLSHGWSTKELSLDPGSSLVPAAENTIEELQQLGEAEEDDDTEN